MGKLIQMVKINILLLPVLCLMSMSHVYAQSFYKWVDEHGTTHYTETPPQTKKGVKTKGQVKTYGQTAQGSNQMPVTLPTKNDVEQAKQPVAENKTTPTIPLPPKTADQNGPVSNF